MSSNFSVSKILELLDKLKAALEAFAARAEKLNSEFRGKVARERHACEKLLQEHQAAQDLARAEIETHGADRRARLEARYVFRKERIGRAYQASKETGLQKIEQSIGGKRYELQKRMLQAERDRDSGYSAAAARLEEMRTAVAVELGRIQELEAEVRRRFRGYGGLARRVLRSRPAADAITRKTQESSLHDLRAGLSKAEATARLCRGPMESLFRFVPLWIALALVPLSIGLWNQHSGRPGLSVASGGIIAGAVILVALVGRLVALKLLSPKASLLADALASVRAEYDACSALTEEAYKAQIEAVRTQFIEVSKGADRELESVKGNAGHLRVSCRMRADDKAVRAGAYNDRMHAARMSLVEKEYHDALSTWKSAGELRSSALRESCDKKVAEITAAYDEQWRALEQEWRNVVPPIFDLLTSAHEAAQHLFPDWSSFAIDAWKPSGKFVNAAKFGDLRANLEQLCTALPGDKRLCLPGPHTLDLPLCLTFPNEGSVTFETSGTGADAAIGALNNIVLRLLANSPPGRVNFTILDPVGLGQNFAGIMHMADYEEQIINSRIWTQPSQIEEKLAQLNEHMEKVIQMYLRNEYATIAEYNEQAGVIAEKYHFLVVADFPNGFTDSAARRLLSIAANGPRCGVYTLLHWDRRQPMTQDFPVADLRKAGLTFAWRGAEFGIVGRALEGCQVKLDAPPNADRATDFIHIVGRASRDSSRVEVPFEHVAPEESEMWSLDTSDELRVAVGRTGATKLQYLAFGKGTRQHGLVAGKTGSGKSTLFHVIVTNLAMWASPEQVEFYLVDFKKGVEFKCYGTQRLPHARVVAIESDREFGLSVLQRVDDELRRRGDLFRKLGVQDIPGYKRAGGTDPLPRCLLLIDEFQEFFVEDDKIAQSASLLLDRIVRQGRAFGIHVLLGSQTLGGAYTVARTTLGQMVVRIALQSNEADAYLIFDDDNPAPRLLSRPGEAIYNDAAGALEGNSPFQVVWLPDSTRDRSLAKVRARADAAPKRYSGPIVFEGNAPSDAAENEELRTVLENPNPTTTPISPRMWLGAPNSIKGPTEAIFRRQSGNNLLIVGQREDAILAMFALGALALSAQFQDGSAEIILLDSSPPGAPEREFIEQFAAAHPRNLRLIHGADMPQTMTSLSQHLKAVMEAGAETVPAKFLMIHALHRLPKLRYEDDFSLSSGDDNPSPGAILNNLVAEGPRFGVHIITSCDSYNSVNRFFTRKTLSEFEMRAVFQMSANDSASLIDSPRASMLGLHRALFFNSQEGYLETFRPYGLPERDWLLKQALKLQPVTSR